MPNHSNDASVSPNHGSLCYEHHISSISTYTVNCLVLFSSTKGIEESESPIMANREEEEEKVWFAIISLLIY
uniref:Uncharacterized protein n=1 Tax=Cannabis sativa TaxID=3483 RepID=A0A803QY88_CANSA